MIRIERRDTEKVKKAVVSLQNAKQKKETYNTKEVNDALFEIFYGKCLR